MFEQYKVEANTKNYHNQIDKSLVNHWDLGKYTSLYTYKYNGKKK